MTCEMHSAVLERPSIWYELTPAGGSVKDNMLGRGHIDVEWVQASGAGFLDEASRGCSVVC
jgi:hypothetical protein